MTETVVQRGADMPLERRGHVIDHRVGAAAELHAGGHVGLVGRVQGERAQGQGGDIDLRPASAGVAGVLDPSASGGGGLDNIRVQLRTGETAVSSLNRPLSSRQMKKRKLGHEGLVPESKGSQAL